MDTVKGVKVVKAKKCISKTVAAPKTSNVYLELTF